MRKRILATIIGLLVLASSARADEQLVQELKTLGQAVDNMSIYISTAASDADAALMAQATQQAFASHFTGDPKPQVSVTATAGRCDVVITSSQWELWSRAEKGAIVDHGATIH